MTSIEISKLVHEQIAGRWDTTNLHGVDLRQCLVLPYEVTMRGTTVKELVRGWVVLEESPDTKEGYKIVLDSQTCEFGLAIGDQDGSLCFLGIYGDFLATLAAM